mgnify:CR=1 FL=1
MPHPVNGRINGTDGHDGAITWLNNATNQDTYGTTVEYKCADGSQFDTTSNGQGDTPTIRTRCQWDKTWSAPASLPSCYVTHCIHPYPIPEDTFLQEITSAWTLVNQKKQYECKGKIGGVHTRFWEADRSKSTFEILCLPDGTFAFDNERESWPTCPRAPERAAAEPASRRRCSPAPRCLPRACSGARPAAARARDTRL